LIPRRVVGSVCLTGLGIACEHVVELLCEKLGGFTESSQVTTRRFFHAWIMKSTRADSAPRTEKREDRMQKKIRSWIVVLGMAPASLGLAAGPARLQSEASLVRLEAEAAAKAQDIPRALELFRRAAESGDAVAQWRLGNAYMNGGPVA